MDDLSRPGPAPRRVTLGAGVRLLARRLRLSRWLAATVLAAGITIWTSATIDDAKNAREAWSSTVAVWILARDIDAGSVIDAGAVRRDDLPPAVVPDAALPGGVDPVGHRLRVAGHRGEVLVEPRLAPPGGSSVAALLPPDSRGVVIPATDPDAFSVGDRADLHDLASGRRLVSDAAVVAVTGDGTMFAVERPAAASVIESLAAGGVVATLIP